MNRRKALQCLLALTAPVLAHASSAAKLPLVHVVKNEGCGCCEEWIKHLQQNGFTVSAQNVDDTGTYRKRLGMPDSLASCHTATVEGYALEGHVPAADIKRLLKEKPKAIGLSVPGMPMGSPGMEGPRKEAYAVLLVTAGGKSTIYQRY